MGYAQGQLRKEALRGFYKGAYKYFEESAADAITGAAVEIHISLMLCFVSK
jgi:hypothetical protein